MLSAGGAFLLAYLPSRQLALRARRELTESITATIDPALRHAIEFSTKAFQIEESIVAKWTVQLADVAAHANLPSSAITGDLAAAVRPHLATPVLEAAWAAGETARTIAIAASMIAHLAYLRCAAPGNAELRGLAEARANELKTAVAALAPRLQQTGLPLVIHTAADVAKLVARTEDLTPTTAAGYRQLNELSSKLVDYFGSTARELDVPPPGSASSPPTQEEDALLALIAADPSNDALREQFAALAAKRGDARAELIRTTDRQRAHDLVRSHPEWTAHLRELGARDIKFYGGFPDEITIDADALLSRGRALLAAAPLTTLHVRAAKGKVGDVVRSPLLRNITYLDLDDQGVTDDDLAALAASPHVTKLRQLDLRYNPIGARGIEALAAAPSLRTLVIVSLDGNPADPVDQVEYYDETHTHRVPTEAGKALEAKYGKLRWLHPK